MSQRRVNETSLTATADALRAKLGTSDPITWVENQGFKAAVESIQTDSGGADVSGVTATETEVLENAIFVDAHGEYKEGTIPRNGDTSATFDGIETKSVDIPAGYTTGGKVELDGTIDNAVEAAKTSLANKGVDVPTDTDVRGLAGLIDGISPGTAAPSAENVTFGNVKTTGVTSVEDGKAYYNGVLLPIIPADVLADFPYCWMNNLQDGTFTAIVAAHPWYYQSGKMNLPVSAENRKYTLASTNAEWALSNTWTDTGGYTVTDSQVMWASHDIPNGSATATDIYFKGSEPVTEIVTEYLEPVERLDEYTAKGDFLNALAGYVQKFIGKMALLTPEGILAGLASVKYIPKGNASAEFTLSFDTDASGILPVVQKGTASSSFALNFESSATGAL